jgi:hypothetical protein
MQWASRFLPDHLPPRMRDFRARFAHHLILKVSHDQIAATRALLARLLPGGETANISNAMRRKPPRPSSTASWPQAPPCAIAPCMPARLRISSPSTLPCPATTAMGGTPARNA